VRNLDIAAIGLELLLIVFLFVDLINGGALLRRRLHGGVLGTGHHRRSPGAPFPRNLRATAQGPRPLGRPDTSPGWRIRAEVDPRIYRTNRALADTRIGGSRRITCCQGSEGSGARRRAAPACSRTEIICGTNGSASPYTPTREEEMAFLRKLLWWKRSEPVQRVRVCIECGMPVGEHKEWCAILKGQQAMRERAAAAGNH
jgi:hypothetical protein